MCLLLAIYGESRSTSDEENRGEEEKEEQGRQGKGQLGDKCGQSSCFNKNVFLFFLNS